MDRQQTGSDAVLIELICCWSRLSIEAKRAALAIVAAYVAELQGERIAIACSERFDTSFFAPKRDGSIHV